jgi:serine protease AprX
MSPRDFTYAMTGFFPIHESARGRDAVLTINPCWVSCRSKSMNWFDSTSPAERVSTHMKKTSRSLRLSVLAVGMLASGLALADAHISPDLVQQLNTTLPGEELTVVVSYEQSTPLSAAQVATLSSLGVHKAITMRSLPIAGVKATPAVINALAQQPDVYSIHPNRELRYFNHEARQISGAARVSENPGDFGRAVPYSGRGVTVVVNDSGIDATHMDLQFGNHVVENVQGLTNLAAWDSILPISYLEGQPNTDFGSGHGTHCAGTVGGTGARSGGLYQGVATGADLVGYGSGAVLLILDSIGGFDYAITNQHRFDYPIRVISNSWGTSGTFDETDPVSIASYEAFKRGIVVAFAAGNDGPGEDTHNPYAQAPWVISVGAGTKDGNLADFSSRGKRGESRSFTMPDGHQWTYYNEPTIVATGVNVISTRDSTGSLPVLSLPADVEQIDPAYLPFYASMDGTSMATPHVAGVIALMLEANPNLTPLQVKDIIERTATNMTGRETWEVGAGHINAYAAVAAAQGIRNDYGSTVNALRPFNSNAIVVPGGAPIPFSIDFAPVGPVTEQSFTVGPEVAYVSARAEVWDNTVALVLTDPDGERYGSSIALPVLGETITVGAAAKPGVWKITVRGIGSVSGVPLDPAGATNGYGLPGTIEGNISFLNSGGYTGLDDIAGHPASAAIQYAVANRLVDGYNDHRFRPDQNIKRSELAQYLLMGSNVRQALPFSGQRSFTDLSTSNPAYPFAEAAVAIGAPLRNLSQQQDGVMKLIGGQFKPNNNVTRLDVAYGLVQSLALQDEARAFSGNMTAFFMGQRVPVLDSASVPASMRGYAQYAIDLGLLNARFVITQGPYDLQPTVQAYFDPNANVTRAAYAVAAGRYLAAFEGVQ